MWYLLSLTRIDATPGAAPQAHRHRHLPETRDTYAQPLLGVPSRWSRRSRVQVTHKDHSIIATLDVVTGELLAPDAAGLSQTAW